MEIKLFNACMKFNLACLDKLGEAEKMGKGGWNHHLYKDDFEEQIKRHVFGEKLTQDRLVDIANYSMFLWNLIEKEKEIIR